jgi:hypothetical protein
MVVAAEPDYGRLHMPVLVCLSTPLVPFGMNSGPFCACPRTTTADLAASRCVFQGEGRLEYVAAYLELVGIMLLIAISFEAPAMRRSRDWCA